MTFLNVFKGKVFAAKFGFILLLMAGFHQANAQNLQSYLIQDGIVKDMSQQLLWQVCPLGQTWHNSRCAGSRQEISWTDAMQLQDAKLKPSHWRLPTQTELQNFLKSIAAHADENTWSGDLIKTKPGELPNFYWTSSVGNGYQTGAWGIKADNQSGHFYFRKTPGWVLLVQEDVKNP